VFFFSFFSVFPPYFTVVPTNLFFPSLLECFWFYSPYLYSSLTQVSYMGGMQGISLVELVREGVVRVVSVGQVEEEKSFFSLSQFICTTS
jgi:hypothetical protein